MQIAFLLVVVTNSQSWRLRMSHHKTEIYLHLVWSTQEREPLITTEVEEKLYSCLATKCTDLKCSPIAIGGTSDHVHLLLRLHPTISVSELLMHLKGTSSYTVNRMFQNQRTTFRWQRGYGVFSVDSSRVPMVTDYILSQKQHHSERNVLVEWEPSH